MVALLVERTAGPLVPVNTVSFLLTEMVPSGAGS